MVDNTTENMPEQRWAPTTTHNTTVVKPTPVKTKKSRLPGNTVTHNDTTTPNMHTGPTRRLTGKQREFIRLMIENPTTPLYAIAEQAGYTGDNATLRSIASENLTKPNILNELAIYDNTAQEVLTEVMMYSKELGKSGTAAGAAYASNARQSAQDILDRLHGKAKQQIETTNRSVTLNIDLTGVTTGDNPVDN